ncbi:MAG: c-type cytochrome [Thermoleophilaceae bacterium]
MRRVVVIALLATLAGCGGGSDRSKVGHDLIVEYGCGACHHIGGVANADGNVGPPLTDFKAHRTIAGRLPRNFSDTVGWLLNPPATKPSTDMPVLNLTPAQARAITEYLYGQ